MRYEESIKEIIEKFITFGGMSGDHFPDMELYMDQAANFMNEKLSIYKKDEKDTVMTKTMIGNYVKHGLIPRPKSKKYDKEHLILLTFIYYLKSSFQMDEIEKLMKPIVDNYQSEFDEKTNISGIYDCLFSMQKRESEDLMEDVLGDIKSIKSESSKRDIADDDITELFMLIVKLSMKADYQKYLAQRLLDEYFMETNSKPYKKPKPTAKAKK